MWLRPCTLYFHSLICWIINEKKTITILQKTMAYSQHHQQYTVFFFFVKPFLLNFFLLMKIPYFSVIPTIYTFIGLPNTKIQLKCKKVMFGLQQNHLHLSSSSAPCGFSSVQHPSYLCDSQDLYVSKVIIRFSMRAICSHTWSCRFTHQTQMQCLLCPMTQFVRR